MSNLEMVQEIIGWIILIGVIFALFAGETKFKFGVYMLAGGLISAIVVTILF